MAVFGSSDTNWIRWDTGSALNVAISEVGLFAYRHSEVAKLDQDDEQAKKSEFGDDYQRIKL